MIKRCDESVRKPLQMIFKSCIENGISPKEWKKDNVAHIHKKGDRQELKNYFIPCDLWKYFRVINIS